MAVETTADLQERLAVLDAAILKIVTGGQVVMAKVDDKMVQFGPGNLTLLRQMRDELANTIACGLGAGGRRRIIHMRPVG